MPQPILKRSQRHPPQAAPSVHFPPSPSLSRTYATHSAQRYDRRCIEVAPNACELPARGCRTYYDLGNQHTPSGKALHPRAIAAQRAEAKYDNEAELERTPTRTSPYILLPVQPPIPSPYHQANHYPSYLSPPPPLVPDLSSSSDESDGFASPPPAPMLGYFAAPNVKSPYFGYPPPQPFYPSPTPPSPPSDRRRRPRRSPSRRPVEDGYDEEDLPGSFSHAGEFRAPPASPTTRDRSPKREGRSRKEKHSVGTLCRTLAGTSINDGCLGGF
uniref:Uncharacterized protein n=1 Tax=Mycena chlorophos TaxID=658473 RepID=A0ABQ0LK50_MYCCL|nr:predicted protein [Mycena chlorophos]